MSTNHTNYRDLERDVNNVLKWILYLKILKKPVLI